MAQQEDFFVVIVPGLMGSDLSSQDGRRVWPPRFNDLFDSQAYLDELAWTPNTSVAATSLSRGYTVLGRRWKQPPYAVLSDFLSNELNLGDRVVDFPYDWRAPLELSAALLADTLAEEAKARGCRAVVLAHSMGGLVARWAIENLGASKHVCDLVLMGTPNTGAPEAFLALKQGPMIAVGNAVLRVAFNIWSRSRKAQLHSLLARTPSFYYLLPRHHGIVDPNGVRVDIFRDKSWLPLDSREEYLTSAQAFLDGLGKKVVGTYSLVGTEQPTCTLVHGQKKGRAMWRNLKRTTTDQGDGVVPLASASLQDPPHSLALQHGELYSNKLSRTWLRTFLTDYACRKPLDPQALRSEISLKTPRIPDLVAPGQKLNVRMPIAELRGLNPRASIELRSYDHWRQNHRVAGRPTAIEPRFGESALRFEIEVPYPDTPDGFEDLSLKIEVSHEQENGEEASGQVEIQFSVVDPNAVQELSSQLRRRDSLAPGMQWMFGGFPQ